MDVKTSRTWGVIVSGALMAGALALSMPNGAPAQAQTPAAVEIAQAGEATPLAFLVRFRGSGPIASAQASAARGRTEQAQRIIEAQLERQTWFDGLCFDRFTVGAAEVVLRTCEPVAAAERAALQARWVQRLRGMRAVEYVDANATATQGRAG